MQPIAESDHGLCGNHKPNRFFRVEQKRKLGLAMQGLVFFRKEGEAYLHISRGYLVSGSVRLE